jgi:hypothetical protein
MAYKVISGNDIPVMSPGDFASLGDGEFAYIKRLDPKENNSLFSGIELDGYEAEMFSLHAADGTPIAFSDSQAAAFADAADHELEVVSLH